MSNIFVSYPRSGRAWFSTIMRRLRNEGIIECRWVKHSHDDATDYTINRYKSSKARWRGHRVVLITRDPRDIVVSHWHILRHRTKRFKEKWGDMSLFEWIQQPEGIDLVIRFLNDWAVQTEVKQISISYEELKNDVVATVARAMKHWRLNTKENRKKFHVVAEVTTDVVKKRWPHSNFEENPDANAVRRAEAGVWREYFSEDEIIWILNKVKCLNPIYAEYRN